MNTRFERANISKHVLIIYHFLKVVNTFLKIFLKKVKRQGFLRLAQNGNKIA